MPWNHKLKSQTVLVSTKISFYYHQRTHVHTNCLTIFICLSVLLIAWWFSDALELKAWWLVMIKICNLKHIWKVPEKAGLDKYSTCISLMYHLYSWTAIKYVEEIWTEKRGKNSRIIPWLSCVASVIWIPFIEHWAPTSGIKWTVPLKCSKMQCSLSKSRPWSTKTQKQICNNYYNRIFIF